jgi:hypothetical protein
MIVNSFSLAANHDNDMTAGVWLDALSTKLERSKQELG